MPKSTPKAKAAAKRPATPSTKARPRPTAGANRKLMRWIDLLAALLGHDQAVPLEQLREEVPGYLSIRNQPALRRTFERDKDELRAFGVPIVTEKDGGGEVRGYRLRRDQFYLPYLSVLQEGRPSKPRKVDRYGYRSLANLTFEADELEAVREAALRVRRLGIPALNELAISAMRKLAFDLPIDVHVPEASALHAPTLSMPRPTPSMGLSADDVYSFRGQADRMPEPVETADIFAVLDTALHQRKRVTIDYTTMSTGLTARRSVLPFGLFFLGHHWYLAARDAEAGADAPVKNFRVSRIRAAVPNRAKPGSADFEIPASFRLPQHARSREAWELGDTATVEAVVRFTGVTGPAMAARRLGEPVGGAPDSRRFQVRRLDTFARWVLSFAGEAEPVSPPELVAAYRQLADATFAMYAGGPA